LRGRRSLPDPGGAVRYTSFGFSGLCHDLPDAGTPGGHRGGRKGRRGTVPAIPGLAEGGAEMRAVLFILKLGLKILAAPVVLALMLFTWLCFGLLYVSSFIFGLASTVGALLGSAVLVTYSPQNGVILLVIAFLVSPLGLPMAAAWLVGKVQDLRYAIQDAVYG